MANISKAIDACIPAQRDSEGLILASEDHEQSFVVDCPSLHIVSASALGVGRIPRGTPVRVVDKPCIAHTNCLTECHQADLIYLGLRRYCPLCHNRETFVKARRIPTPELVSRSRLSPLDRERHSRSLSLSPPPISISPPPTTFRNSASTLSISTATSDTLLELPQCSSPLYGLPDLNESVISFSPTPSITGHPGIYPHSGGSAGPNVRSPPTLPARIQSFPPPSIISSDTSSTRGVEDTPRSFSGFFNRKKRKETPKTDGRVPLPNSLAFVFSASGRNLLLWRKNGHSLIHIKISSWESKSLPMKLALPSEETDHGINIKLVAEGDGWISAVLYHKQVCVFANMRAHTCANNLSAICASHYAFFGNTARSLANRYTATTDYAGNVTGQFVRCCRLRTSRSFIPL
jgi:hypothetical protein